MTNLSRWRLYCKDLTSPDIFIDIAFYFMISASLQRRVYLGSDERPLFGNQYIILVADPGIGKGLVLKPVDEFLRYHKYTRFRIANAPTPPPEQVDSQLMQSMIDEFQRANNLQLPPSVIQQHQQMQRITRKEEPLLIPMAMDAGSYEALVSSHARSYRAAPVSSEQGKTSRLLNKGIYSHSSICFTLEEISSLFRKHTENVVNYLIRAYDCGSYQYETQKRGIEEVKNMCLNFLGGTQPSFMRSSFNDKLLNEGFASRTLFVHANANRFECFDLYKPLTPDQQEAKACILQHIRNLADLFGLVRYTPEAYAFMRSYVERDLPAERKKAPAKLLSYFARKRVHLEKLAMAVHFSDNTSYTIELSSCLAALELLNKIQQDMDKALDVGGRNPLGGIAAKLAKFLHAKGAHSFSDIWIEFVDEVNEKELTEMLNFLVQTERAECIEAPSKTGQHTIMKYRLKEKV